MDLDEPTDPRELARVLSRFGWWVGHPGFSVQAEAPGRPFRVELTTSRDGWPSLALTCRCRNGARRRQVRISVEGVAKLVSRRGSPPELDLDL
ncbi:MAG TPA: hypothetical protein VNO79_15970 [Actinomycetota bacterium]|nr:hypothetical protein [Actinomycetota bacterium]